MWRNPMPWKNSPDTPNISTLAQTDDIRPGLGWEGLKNLETFVAKGGVLVGVANTAEFAVTFGPDERREREQREERIGRRQPAAVEARR
jgi:hypothetical protein